MPRHIAFPNCVLTAIGVVPTPTIDPLASILEKLSAILQEGSTSTRTLDALPSTP